MATGSPIDLTGQRFDRLVAQRPVGSTIKGRIWLCVCDCGAICQKFSGELRSSRKTKMCLSCRKVEQKKQLTIHGLSTEHAVYRIWAGIRKRCRDPKDKGYRYYGARGIDRCAEWDDFARFHAWAVGAGYAPGLTLDRLDPNKGYAPDNCEWVSKAENTNRKNLYHHMHFLDFICEAA